MSGKRYTEKFKVAAVKQVIARGKNAVEVAERLGVSIHGTYVGIKRYGMSKVECKAQFRGNRQPPFLRYDQQFAIGRIKETLHGAVNRIHGDGAAAHRFSAAITSDGLPAVDEVDRHTAKRYTQEHRFARAAP